MNQDTVTLATTDRGDVTIPEPSWCTGVHDQDGYRVDLSHTGPEHHLTFDGEVLWTLLLTQDPFSSLPARRQVGLYVEQSGYARTLDVAGLDALAAALVEHAAELRRHARELGVLRDGGVR